MPANEQAYTAHGSLPDTTSEYNRLSFVVQSILAQQATTTLVIVKAVDVADPDHPQVDAQPMVSQIDGAGNAIDHGIIHGMPVWRLQGGASAVIVVPAVGDIGVAVFASTDISNVKRAKEPATPGSFRRQDWSDGIYFGGILNTAATQFVRMDEDGVTITAGEGLPVTINAPGDLTINADNVTMSGDLQVDGDVTVDGSVDTGAGSTFNGKAFDSHHHSGVTTGGGTSGPPS